MEKGVLVQTGAPKSLYEKPSTQFVADFLGTVSFLPATIKKQTKSTTELKTDNAIITATNTLKGLKTGDKVLIAIRPEKILLSRQKPQGKNCLAVTVEDLAFTGVATYYRVRDRAGNLLKIHQQNRSDTEELTWDDKGYASFCP